MRGYHCDVRILGIDPGLATVGIGVVDYRSHGGLHLIDCCTIETAKTLASPMRLLEIAEDLTRIVHKYKPDRAVVEKLYFETNRKTAMEVAQARGVILCALEREGIPILEPTPLELKAAITGDGRADKRQMQDMLTLTLKLPKDFFRGIADDASDALALAVYGILHSPRELLDREKRNVRIAA